MNLSKKLYRPVAWLVALCGSIWPFFFVRIHANMWDEFYQALGIRSFETSALSPLTSVFGAVWCDLFGETIVSLRCCAIVALLLSIAIGIGFMRRRGYSPMQCAVAYAVLCMSLTLGQYYSYGHNIFGWDTISYPFLVITTVSLLIWIETRQLVWLVLSGVGCGLLSASRLPSGVAIIVIVACVLSVKDNWRGRLADCLIAVINAVIVLLAVVTLIYGSPVRWIDSMGSSVITGHSPGEIIFSCLNVLPSVALYWLPGVAMVVILLIVRNRQVAMLLAIAVACVIYILCYSETTLATGYMQMPCMILLACAVFVPRSKRVGVSSFIVTAAMFICMAFGSDVLPDRIMGVVLAAIVVALYNPALSSGFPRRFMIAYAASIVILSTVSGLRAVYHLGQCIAFEHGHSGQLFVPQNEFNMLSSLVHPAPEGSVIIGRYKYAYSFILTDDAVNSRRIFHYDELTQPEMDAEISKIEGDKYIILRPGLNSRFAVYAAEQLKNKYMIVKEDAESIWLERRTSEPH